VPIFPGGNFPDRPRFHRGNGRLQFKLHVFEYFRGSSFGGRFPLRVAPSTGM
jgi:hypothetical protein